MAGDTRGAAGGGSAVLTGAELCRTNLGKARLRMEKLQRLAERGGWSDLVREAQELEELASKAMLRRVGIDPAACRRARADRGARRGRALAVSPAGPLLRPRCGVGPHQGQWPAGRRAGPGLRSTGA
ncbi:MAG: hypothetical protein ER33_06215 [Cyanobium sp. CACIAM 14]|nr:MAG: hypothetical protein ER33_06215 [Cyanobium sp. CACIAM 14]